MLLGVKYRKKILLNPDLVKYLKNICFDIGERYWFEFDAIGTDGDHVHIFVGSEPKYSPSRVMQIIKSITARELFKAYPEIKRELWGGEFWSDGGYIRTVGDGVTSEIIRNYIEQQGDPEEKDNYKQLELFEFK